MKPKEFPEQNVIFAKDQPEYQPLPALRVADERGEVVTCWSLSFKERLRVLFRGEIWLCMLTFNKPLTPTFLTADRNEILKK